MREILFRAKTASIVRGFQDIDKPDGTWVYGYYRDKVALPTISEFDFRRADYIDYEVDIDTLCQFTGLFDKNGKKIFEGDIVSFSSCYYNGNDTPYKGVVKWSDMKNISTRFMIWHDNESEYYGKDGAFDLDLVHFQDDEIEVIGNIHDNPELLS